MKKIHLFLAVTLLASLALFGCNPPKPDIRAKAAAPAGLEMMAVNEEAAAPMPSPAAPKPQKAQASMTRKIVYSANFKIEVADVQKAITQIKGLAYSNKGYLESSWIKKDENKRRFGSVNLRVPPANLDRITAEIKKLGNVLDESLTSEDVTKYYYDLKARLKNSQRFEARIIKLLETKTAKLKDVLETEQELSRIRESIEGLQGEINYYNNLVSLSSVQIDISEAGTVIPSKGNIFQPVIDTTFEAIGAFLMSLGSILVLLAAALPWLILAAIVAYTGRLIWKRRK